MLLDGLPSLNQDYRLIHQVTIAVKVVPAQITKAHVVTASARFSHH